MKTIKGVLFLMGLIGLSSILSGIFSHWGITFPEWRIVNLIVGGIMIGLAIGSWVGLKDVNKEEHES